jgi:hypothetical protein
MTIRNLYATATDVSQIHSISVTENHNASTSTAVIECGSHNVTIGDTVSIDIGYTTNHTVVFNGFAKQIDYVVPTKTYRVTCKDTLIRAVDFFIVSENPDEPFSRRNIAAEDLVRDVLSLAGLTSYTYDATYFVYATGEEPAEVNIVSAYDYCKGLADLLTWNLWADVSGTIHFENRKPYVMENLPEQPGHSADVSFKTVYDSSIISISKGVNEKDLRNRVVIYGSEGVYASASSSTSYDPETDSNIQVLPSGFYKTALLSSTLIASTGYAQTAATYNLARWNRLWYTSSIEIEGDPTLGARKVITVNSTRMGINYDWYILQATHNWSRSGYLTQMQLIR